MCKLWRTKSCLIVMNVILRFRMVRNAGNRKIITIKDRIELSTISSAGKKYRNRNKQKTNTTNEIKHMH